MRHLSSVYLNSLQDFSDEKSERPYATEGGMDLIRQEDAQKMRASLLNRRR